MNAGPTLGTWTVMTFDRLIMENQKPRSDRQRLKQFYSIEIKANQTKNSRKNQQKYNEIKLQR